MHIKLLRFSDNFKRFVVFIIPTRRQSYHFLPQINCNLDEDTMRKKQCRYKAFHHQPQIFAEKSKSGIKHPVVADRTCQ